MARSFLEQLTQIRRSRTYDDAVADIYTSAVAEPTVSGSLQDDLNVVRTLMKSIKGSTDWYSDLGNYFDPTATTSGSTETKALNLTNIKNNTLDAKTVIVPVTADNSGSGYTVSGTSTGIMLSGLGVTYADQTDRTGLPIYASTNTGVYFDVDGSQNVCRVDIINVATGAEMEDGSNHTIYGMIHDAADNAGTADTDAYIKFYADGSECDLSGADPAPTAVSFIYPRRKTMSSMEEHEWLRTDFVNSWEGDVELIEDIVNLWSFTGASNDDGTAGPWTNPSANWILATAPTDLESAIDLLNDGVGNRTYTSTYIVSGEAVSASLNKLGLGIEGNDTAISTNAGNISTNAGDIDTLESSMGTAETDISNLEAAVGSSTGATGLIYSSNNYVTNATSLETAIGALDAAITSSSAQKYIETTSAVITAGIEHALPAAAISAGGYTTFSGAGQEGANMDVYVSGQMLAADTGYLGATADRDYGETSTSGVTFRFTIPSGTNIIYVIRQ